VIRDETELRCREKPPRNRYDNGRAHYRHAAVNPFIPTPAEYGVETKECASQEQAKE